MVREYGIFGDEGLYVGQYYDRAEAEADLRDYEQGEARVAECCPDHPDQERGTCERCNAEDDDESDEDDEG